MKNYEIKIKLPIDKSEEVNARLYAALSCSAFPLQYCRPMYN